MIINNTDENIDLLEFVKKSDFERKNLCTFEEMMNEYKKDQIIKKNNDNKINKNQNGSSYQTSTYRINNIPNMKKRKNTFVEQLPKDIINSARKKKQSVDISLNEPLAIVKENTKHSNEDEGDTQQSINNYEVKQIIGRGAFADVKICVNINTKQTYAMKILNEHKMKKKMFSRHLNEPPEESIKRQITILSKLDHPNICKFYEAIQNKPKNQIYLIMEYCEKGNINSISKNDQISNGQNSTKIISEKQVKKYMKELLSALDYLHNEIKLAHRDLKPQNLLLSANNQVKLIDFGLSTFDEQTENKAGTRIMMAPQTFIQQSYDTRIADIWSFGLTLLILVTGKAPYKDQVNEFELKSIILNHIFNFEMEIMSENLKKFLGKCLEKDPKKRATVKALLKDQWLVQNPLRKESNKQLVEKQVKLRSSIMRGNK